MLKIARQKWVKGIFVAVVFIAVFLITFSLNRSYIQKNTDMAMVVVATQKIKAYSSLSRNQVALAKRPRSIIPSEALYDTAVLFSDTRYYSADLGFGEGDIVRLDRLTTSQNSSPASLMTLAESGKMLVAVNTNLVRSCANLVVPGTVVNAVVVMPGKGVSDSGQVIGPDDDPCLADLLVVDKKNADAAEPAAEGREAIPAVVTLIMDKGNLETAKALVSYNETGSVYLLPVGFNGDVSLSAKKN